MISRELVEIGAIDAVFVSLIVTFILMPIVKYSTKILLEREVLQNEVAERRQREVALRESEESYRVLFNQDPLPGWVYDTETYGFLLVNDAAQQQYGYTSEEFLSMTIKDIRPSDDSDRLLEFSSEIRDRSAVSSFWRHRKKDGTLIDVEINSHPILFGGKKARRVIVHDITERKRLQNEVLLREQRLNSFFKGATAGLALFDRDLRFMRINDTLAEINGFPAKEHIGRTVREILPELAPVIEPIFQRVLAGGEPVLDIEVTGETPRDPGVRRHWLESFFPVVDAEGNMDGVGTIVVEITRHKRAEEALMESERKYKSLVETTVDGIYQSDADGFFRFINQAGAEMFGHKSPEEMIGKSVLGYWADPKERASFLDKLKRAKGLKVYPLRGKKKDGSVIHLEMSSHVLEDGQGRFMGIEGILRDVTERVDLEAQLRHAQKLEAVGQLAGGVAHDFNNILSAIMGYGTLAEMKLPHDHPVRHYMQQILQSSERAAALTRGLLAFSRKQPLRLELLGINEVIGKFEKFLRRLLREDIELNIHYADEELKIMADRGQIEQVVMNLVTNARDAMPNKGRLSIETMRVVLGDDFVTVHGYGRTGDFAVIAVTDSGVGMDGETREKIFEPFFTTKEVGKGTGLGLATAYGIVKSHDGFINVYSEPGRGTSFKIYLPVVHPAGGVQPPAVQQLEEIQGGTETILLAEDDAALLTMTSLVLRQMGYTVIEAANGNEAVDKFVEYKNAIKLVILDGIMPGMNGKEVYSEVTALCPDMRCLFISGYAEDIFTKDGIQQDEVAFLTKPILPSVLLKKVREVLDK
ncbi:MAG: PAS domain S-box protein [Thermodesulfovibrionales bacterium]